MFGVDFTNCIKMECSKQIAILTRVMLLDQFNVRNKYDIHFHILKRNSFGAIVQLSFWGIESLH
jgi:hypothetical protein